MRKGQALITLLVFTIIVLTIGVGSAAMLVVNLQSSQKQEVSLDALSVAESGADNALLRLLRNPNYSGETLTVGSGTSEVVVSGSGTKTIVSTGTVGSHVRKIQVTAGYVNNILTVLSWEETF